MTHSQARGEGVPNVGEVIAGKYRVEHVLAEGGMGIVVAARHVHLDQQVALKFLLPEAAAVPGAVPRFLREAKTAAGITSEHVARTLDFGVLDNGSPYLVMEFLTGTDLSSLLASRGSLRIDVAVDYVLQACEALAEAHAMGIVHRDLKPSNLFLTTRADGSALVKLIDFGISKIRKAEGVDSANLTATNTMLGTPQYMSPEQLREAKAVDVRADIWAIGMILHELVAGHLPFQAETMSGLVAKILIDPPTPLSHAVMGLPIAFEALVLRCLEKDPNKRPAHLGELAQALAPFASAAAQTSVERIMTLAGGRAPARPPHLTTDPLRAETAATVSSGVHSGATVNSWGTTAGTSQRTSRAPAIVIGLVVATLGLGAVAAWFSVGRTPASASNALVATASPVATATSAATPPPPVVEPAPAPSSDPAPSASQEAAATSAAPSASAAAQKPTAPATRQRSGRSNPAPEAPRRRADPFDGPN